ncbi:MAG: aldo/keto reductase, partial [Bacillota bacterium]|nr:aldo/keto reductase [Bacillota bacterium]
VLGKILSNGYRERIKLATKMPPYLIKKREDFDKIFNAQLQRLQTDYIDYYFMHMLTDVKVWNRLVDLGVLDWIAEKKKSGQIKNIGFSYHGGKQEFVKLVDIYDWEFCMIQYNYLDENKQAGKSGLKYAASKGLPVFIMEPLRGGRLVNSLPKEAYKVWEQADVKRSPAEWAFRWLWNQPEVTVVLSGMNSMEMLDENIRVASEAQANEFTEKELDLFSKLQEILEKTIKVPCTGCNYCMPCPFGVDIPTCFALYNDREITGKMPSFIKYLMQTSMRVKSSNASLCKKCGKCETHCPQKIQIRNELQNVSKTLEGFLYKPARFTIKTFMKLK